MINREKLIEDIRRECYLNGGGLYEDQIIYIIESQEYAGQDVIEEEMIIDEKCDFTGLTTKEEYLNEMLSHKEFFEVTSERQLYYYCVNVLSDEYMMDEENAEPNCLRQFLFDLIDDYFDNYMEEQYVK